MRGIIFYIGPKWNNEYSLYIGVHFKPLWHDALYNSV